jgi:luciferase family oxidoreductase group 1
LHARDQERLARVSVFMPALSVLDHVLIRPDQTSGDAIAATTSMARRADVLGYRRYWIGEHHNVASLVSTNPSVLLGLVAAATERIRVGSGGIILPNYGPLAVAENFAGRDHACRPALNRSTKQREEIRPW